MNHICAAALAVLLCSCAVASANPQAAGSSAEFPEPSELPSSPQLPDPLVCLDGTRVTTAEQWEDQRRPELKALFQHYMYGTFPPARFVGIPDYKVEREEGNYFGGKATKKEVTIRFGPDGTPPLHLLVVLPKGSGPVPVFVGANFHGNHTLLDDPTIALPEVWMPDRAPGVEGNKATDAGRGKDVAVWNIEYVVGRGYGVATFYCGDLDPDKPDSTDGIQPHFRRRGQTEPGVDECATVAA